MQDNEDVGKSQGAGTEDHALRRQALRERHDKKLRARERAAAAKKTKHVVEMAPQPPRDLRLMEAGHNFLVLQWKIPILDGGAEVYEYELSYACNHRSRVGKKMVDDIVEQPPQLTTRWILQKPVAETGFTLTNLRAGSQYCNFTVRCRNAVRFCARAFESKTESTYRRCYGLSD